MKITKRILIIIGIVIMIILYAGKVYAIMPIEVYNPVSVIISNILKNIPIVLIVVYSIWAIIYYSKSKQYKKHKIRILLIWLPITIVIGTILYFCAEPVSKIGISYTSSQNEFRKYTRKMENEK